MDTFNGKEIAAKYGHESMVFLAALIKAWNARKRVYVDDLIPEHAKVVEAYGPAMLDEQIIRWYKDGSKICVKIGESRVLHGQITNWFRTEHLKNKHSKKTIRFPIGSIVFVGPAGEKWILAGQNSEGFLPLSVAAVMQETRKSYEVIGMATTRSYLVRCVKTGKEYKVACNRCVGALKGTGEVPKNPLTMKGLEKMAKEEGWYSKPNPNQKQSTETGTSLLDLLKAANAIY